MPIAPVMIYGDDVSHVVTEEGIAHLHKAEGIDERRAALAAVAGVTPIGLRAKPEKPRNCGGAASSRIPRISASAAVKQSARCWPHAASTIW
jgi:hypothetical protein